MGYHIRQFEMPNGGLFTEVWEIGHGTAVRLGVSNAEHSPGSYFQAATGEDIWSALRQLTPWFEPNDKNPFQEAHLQPGQFTPRIVRPNSSHPHETPGWHPIAKDYDNVVAIARGQLTTLTRQLDRICLTVQPDQQNYGTYGHDIRNLLILACTEVESHWRGVLVANGVKKERFNTHDYVALQPAMRLGEYAVAFPQHPWLAPLSPFQGWGSSNRPTADLQWYDAYNAVKHDREENFSRATLRHAFEAVTACAIMMVAQFGYHGGLGQQSEL